MSSDDDNIEQQKKNIQVLNYLLEKGARVNEKDFYGLTPLHHACLRGNHACVETLLNCSGINVEVCKKSPCFIELVVRNIVLWELLFTGK